MKSMFHLFGALACVVALSACGGKNETVAVAVDATITPSAYSATDTTVGTGTVAAAGDLVTVDYTGWLYNSTATAYKGTQFESSVGGNPESFTLGAGLVLAGWDQGIVGMKVGGTRTLIVTPSLGYGSTAVTVTGAATTGGSFVVPAKSGLVFEITLVAVKKAGT